MNFSRHRLTILAVAVLPACSKAPPAAPSTKSEVTEKGSGGIIVSSETYDARGMSEDDAEVSLSIEPLPRTESP